MKKRILIAFLFFIMAAGMIMPAALVADSGTLSYTVSPKSINMTAGKTGSFVINVPKATSAYAGVEFMVMMPDGVELTSIGYNLRGVLTIPPAEAPHHPGQFGFGCYGQGGQSQFTSDLICTVNIKYKDGVTPTKTSLTILSVTQYFVTGHAQENLISDQSTELTIIPYSNAGVDPDLEQKPDDPVSPTPDPTPTPTPTPTPHPGTTPRAPGSSGNPLSGSLTYNNTIAPTDDLGKEDMGTEEIDKQDVPGSGVFPFTDVIESDWFYEDVYYAWSNELVRGTSETTFGPDTAITRGMVVTILYRSEGEPSVTGLENPFRDVEEDEWYTDAIKWAVENGVVLGYDDGTYGPNVNVSRQELATILFRYAGSDLPEKRDYTAFADETNIEVYAVDPVKALYVSGIINGKPGNVFDPLGTATRAEFVAMIHRLFDAGGA